MEPQPPTQRPSREEFAPGSPVVYGLIGRCTVLAVETKSIGQNTLRFYKLEAKKTVQTRSKNLESAIWVPVANAQEQGLRAPANQNEAADAVQTLMNREYFFKTTENWSTILPTLENTIRSEGIQGLAKVYSYLYILKRRQLVSHSEFTKFYELVHRLLFRELSESLSESMKSIEDRVQKGLKGKLTYDH
jgi:RNA polymerase-interacting CarD/CdnL/TRCF family regulator